MPLIDLPLAQLLTYEGRNPKPEDFDAYWQRGLADMKAIDPAVELVASNFIAPGVECFDLYFTGVGGARIHAKYARPKQVGEPHPAILMFHGYAGHAGDWLDKVGYAALGFSVLAMDVRGQGGSSQDCGSVRGTTLNGHIIRGLDDHPDQLLFRQVFLDTAKLAEVAMQLPEVDATKVYATGGSQGGGLTLACAALEPRIAKVAPAYPFLCDYRRVWEMDLATQAYQELRNYFRSHDPRHEREEEIFTTLGYIDVQHLASRIRGKVQMAVGLADTICPPSTQFAAYNRIPSEKRYLLYPDFGHEHLPGFADATLSFFLAD
ncbi:MAG: alpha/beta fold hydrolase [Firmicutes bacterium]|nr:alpha/beta fold hydrolase [Bacillota bacterium]